MIVPGEFSTVSGTLQFPIIEMDSPDRIRTLAITIAPEERVLAVHTADSDSEGPSLLVEVVRGTETVGLSAVNVRSGNQRGASTGDYKSIQVSGAMGIGLGYDLLQLSRENNKLIAWSGIGRTPLPLPALNDQEWQGRYAASLAIRNRHFSAIVPMMSRSERESIGQLDVWISPEKSGEWKRYKWPCSVLAARGFGKWLAGQYSNYSDEESSVAQPDRNFGRRNCAQMELHRELTFPGILYLLNTQTGRFITWETGEEDSEILLAENDKVIYRMGTRLYEARIFEQTVGDTELLVESDVILDVHWAFWGPPPATESEEAEQAPK